MQVGLGTTPLSLWLRQDFAFFVTYFCPLCLQTTLNAPVPYITVVLIEPLEDTKRRYDWLPWEALGSMRLRI